MLIISAGMQKSGSGYLYNLINDLEVAGGKTDARAIKQRRRLENIMQQHNNNIGPLHLTKLLHLWWISVRENDFVVKTHAPPGPGAKLLNSMGMVRIIYCFRDPRDVLLSAIDHGLKSVQEGIDDTFSKMTEFDIALRNVHGWTQVWKDYSSMPRVLMVKYESLLGSPMETLQEIQHFLNIAVTPGQCREILWKYSRENKNGDRTGMHFNKAVTARYATEMTEEQKKVCQQILGNELEQMGYPAS